MLQTYYNTIVQCLNFNRPDSKWGIMRWKFLLLPVVIITHCYLQLPTVTCSYLPLPVVTHHAAFFSNCIHITNYTYSYYMLLLLLCYLCNQLQRVEFSTCVTSFWATYEFQLMELQSCYVYTSTLDSSKSCGPDNIPTCIFKHCSDEIAPPPS